jgi:hypothetical protein
MSRTITIGTAIAAIAAAVLPGGALAQSAAYTWTGMGQKSMGGNKCPTYKMTIDVTVEGRTVKGLFQQEGRDQRHFEATMDDNGVFRTKAIVGGGNTIDVVGTIRGSDTKVVLDGYCKFDAKLTKK